MTNKRLTTLTPDMARVLKAMQDGKVARYDTTMMGGRPWIDDEASSHPIIRASTLKGLLHRGLVEQRYAYPIGTVVLTKKGKEHEIK